jgi:6-phosphogluconolactonase
MKTLRITESTAFSALVANDLKALAAKKEGHIHIALPGGRSAASIIEAIVAVPDILFRTTLYLVDERLEGERNSDTLLDVGLQVAFDRGLMDRTQLKVPAVGEVLSTSRFDRVYLGIGEDGHFASLFPGSFTTEGNEQVILVPDSPKPPLRRATLSYHGFRTLAQGAEVFLLYFGESKREALNRMLASQEGPLTLPSAFFKTLECTLTIITDLEA